eukprot:gnl/MRDRNA2_/MRDRNA2_59107_c0_seq1.p1 gnl/MRDRNA2_/MRDRNA2_59107_c0~~gnl/MRDRNA2_/MRDRNA2_59107_c0_seq1.p1  ORF type:complete len:213 (+),score=37.61 gnl/MRDRNA2_/MRDRNA2_59107_c0_seq1:63-641(+)
MTGERLATVEASPDDTVHTVRIAAEQQSNRSYMRLLLNGTRLQEAETLKDSGIDASASTLFAMFIGGEKAEWLARVENGWGFGAIPKELQRDPDIAFAVVSKTGTALRRLGSLPPHQGGAKADGSLASLDSSVVEEALKAGVSEGDLKIVARLYSGWRVSPERKGPARPRSRRPTQLEAFADRFFNVFGRRS